MSIEHCGVEIEIVLWPQPTLAKPLEALLLLFMLAFRYAFLVQAYIIMNNTTCTCTATTIQQPS